MPKVLALNLDSCELEMRGFDRLWQVMRDIGQNSAVFTIKDIERHTRKQCFTIVRDYVRRLEKAKVLECVGQVSEGSWKGAKKFRLLATPRTTPSVDRDGQPSPRHKGQSQMWTAIRALDRFTKHDIALAASTSDHVVPVATAAQYLKALKAAGYFLVAQRGGPNKPEILRLRPDMKTGPLPPRVLRTKAVYDQNRRKIVGPVEFEEATA